MFCSPLLLSEPTAEILESPFPMASAAKKARMSEPTPYSELDVSSIVMKVHEDDNGKYVHAVLDGYIPIVNLTPTGSMKIVWGFDMIGSVDKKSFNSPGTEGKANESLSIRVSLDDSQTAFIKNVEAKCKELYKEIAPKHEWQSMVSHNTYHDCQTVTLKICLKGQCTALKILEEGQVIKGAGWDFLKSTKGSSGGFKDGDIKAVVKPRIWTQNGKVSISLDATQVFIKPGEKVTVDAFADDCEW